MIGGSLVSTDGKVLSSDKGIKLGSTYGRVLGIVIENIGEITPGLDVVTELSFLDGYFIIFKDVNIDDLLHG